MTKSAPAMPAGAAALAMAFGLAAGARARALFDTRFTEAGGIAAWEGIHKELKLGGAAASPVPAGVVETPA